MDKNTQTVLCIHLYILILRSVYSFHVDPRAGNILPKFPATHKRSSRSFLGPIIPPAPCSKTERVSLPHGGKQNFIPVSIYLIGGKILVYNVIKRS